MQIYRYAVEAQHINRFYDAKTGMLPDEVRDSLLQSAQPIPAPIRLEAKVIFLRTMVME